MNTISKKRVAIFLLISVLVAGLSSGCSKENVIINANKVSIAKSKCSIIFDSLTEITDEKARELMNEEQKAKFLNNNDFSFWEVSFSHEGDHDWPVVKMVANKGMVPVPNFTYYYGAHDYEAEILSGNLGNSHAFLDLEKIVANTPKNCKFNYEGYSFTYDFQDSEWTYSESK